MNIEFTPEMMTKAFEKLKAKGVSFPHQVSLTWMNVTRTVIFQDDGRYDIVEPNGPDTSSESSSE